SVRARVHDHQSPSRAHDWQRVWVEHDGTETDMHWYGEYLWRADIVPTGMFRVCAKDRRGNQACGAPGASGDGPPPGGDAGSTGPGTGAGCCETGTAPATPALGAIVLGFALRRRRRSPGAQCQ